MPEVDIIILGTGQSLIYGNLNPRLELCNLMRKQAEEQKEINSFGLFDTAAPNLVSYYPDVTEKDLNPDLDKESFVYPVFRALSEVVVHKKSNPVDFSKNGVLKKSQDFLIGQTVYVNHEMLVGNEVGVVLDTEWQDAYVTKNGILVPAGFNARLKIDGKSHPSIARGVTMSPPSIHSTSVTVEFLWEKSHPKMNDEEFRNKLGSYGSDKELIRRVALEIPRYHEISFVSHGADPYAKKVDKDGKIVNPEHANRVYNTAQGTDVKPQAFFFSYKSDITSLSENPINNKQNQIQMKEKLILMATLLAIANVSSLTDEDLANQVEAKLKEVKTNGDTAQAEVTRLKAEALTKDGQITALTAERDTAKTSLATKETEVATLTTEITTLKALEPLKAIVEKEVTECQAELKRVYGVLNATPDATVLASFDNKDLNVLKPLLVNYQAQLEEKFPGQCLDCKSKNVTRKVSNGEGNPGTEKLKGQPLIDSVKKEFASNIGLAE
jgi:hypothetical protein